MSIITSVYGEVAADGEPVANGEPWWLDHEWDNGVYGGAFSSKRTATTSQYQILFAPGTFAYDPGAGVNQPPALAVTAGSVSANGPEGNGPRSPKIIQWSIEETRANGVSVNGWMATVIFVDESGGLVSTPFSFVATGPLGAALTTTVNVHWNSDGKLSLGPGQDKLTCSHPMTLEWVPTGSSGNSTTEFYITAILGLPSGVFGIPEGVQRKGTITTPLIWRAFNNCPEATSTTPTVYQYTIFAARKTTKNDTTAVEVAYLDPRITNGASTGS